MSNEIKVDTSNADIGDLMTNAMEAMHAVVMHALRPGEALNPRAVAIVAVNLGLQNALKDYASDLGRGGEIDIKTYEALGRVAKGHLAAQAERVMKC